MTAPIAALNFWGCLDVAGRFEYDGGAGNAAGFTATVGMTATLNACVGIDRCSYFATPANLVGRNGVPVAPFADFPVTIVP